MIRPMPILLLSAILFAAAPARAADEPDGFDALPVVGEGAEAIPAPTSGPALLADCLARMPADPVTLTGWVRDRKPRGVVAQEFNFTALLQWGAPVPSVQYTFSEKDGTTLARATVHHPAATGSELVLQTGADLAPADPPAWNATVLDTDITWLDLSMDFLHWQKAELAGEASVRGRLCDLVEVYPPTPIPGCRKVRLWVDRQIRMFLQAQEVDETGRINRQMWVRSVKKMGERWMVQDIEVETRSRGHRTRLHVLTCE